MRKFLDNQVNYDEIDELFNIYSEKVNSALHPTLNTELLSRYAGAMEALKLLKDRHHLNIFKEMQADFLSWHEASNNQTK